MPDYVADEQKKPEDKKKEKDSAMQRRADGKPVVPPKKGAEFSKGFMKLGIGGG